MTKSQFWILSLVAIVTTALLLFNVGFAQYNRSIDRKVQESQVPLATAPKLQRVAQNLIVRLASESRKDEEIRELLARHKMEVRFQEKE